MIGQSSVKYFIGTWENWKYLLKPENENETSDDFYLLQRHLLNTSCMLIYSIKHNNADANLWAVDTLLHWYKIFSIENNSFIQYQCCHEVITESTLKHSEDHKLIKHITQGSDFLKNEAQAIALRNLWIDTRCLAAAYILGSTQKTEQNQHTGENITLIKHLLNGQSPLEDSGHKTTNRISINRPQQIIAAYLRQLELWGDLRTYPPTLDHFLDKYANINWPSMISGRIYTRWGTNKDRYTLQFFQVFGIGFSSNEFQPDRKWLTFLKSDALTANDRDQAIRELKRLQQVNDDIISLVCAHFRLSEDAGQNRLDNFSKSITHLVSELEVTNTTQIQDSEIDDEALKEFGRFATGHNFNLMTGPMPLSFFDGIEYIAPSQSSLISYNIGAFPKQEVSKDLGMNRLIDMDDWLEKQLRLQVSLTVFKKIESTIRWKEHDFDDPEILLSHVVKDSKLIQDQGLSPVLIVGSPELVTLINKAHRHPFTSDIELPYEFTKETDKDNRYLRHINGIEVYTAPFRGVNVARFGDGQCVQVSFEPTDDIASTLKLEYGIECKLKTQNMTCIKYLMTVNNSTIKKVKND